MSMAKRFIHTPTTTVKVPVKFHNTAKRIVRALDDNPDIEESLIEYLNLHVETNENHQYTSEELNKTGVYSILNLSNGKQYVGSTTRSFKERWHQHKSALGLNKHYSKYLQSSWDECDKGLFQFIIIEYCEPEQCLTREQHYLDSLNVCDREFGYNTCPTAGSPLGRKGLDETKAKLMLANINKKHSPEFIIELQKQLLEQLTTN